MKLSFGIYFVINLRIINRHSVSINFWEFMRKHMYKLLGKSLKRYEILNFLSEVSDFIIKLLFANLHEIITFSDLIFKT